jgi:hypothetical protein
MAELVSVVEQNWEAARRSFCQEPEKATGIFVPLVFSIFLVRRVRRNVWFGRELLKESDLGSEGLDWQKEEVCTQGST